MSNKVVTATALYEMICSLRPKYPVNENIPGVKDVEFYALGIHVVMVSVNMLTRSCNVWWQLQRTGDLSPDDWTQFGFVQANSEEYLRELALSVCFPNDKYDPAKLISKINKPKVSIRMYPTTVTAPITAPIAASVPVPAMSVKPVVPDIHNCLDGRKCPIHHKHNIIRVAIGIIRACVSRPMIFEVVKHSFGLWDIAIKGNGLPLALVRVDAEYPNNPQFETVWLYECKSSDYFLEHQSIRQKLEHTLHDMSLEWVRSH